MRLLDNETSWQHTGRRNKHFFQVPLFLYDMLASFRRDGIIGSWKIIFWSVSPSISEWLRIISWLHAGNVFHEAILVSRSQKALDVHFRSRRPLIYLIRPLNVFCRIWVVSWCRRFPSLPGCLIFFIYQYDQSVNFPFGDHKIVISAFKTNISSKYMPRDWFFPFSDPATTFFKKILFR